MIKKPGGVLFVFLVFLSSLLAAVFLLIPFVPLAYFYPKVWRIIADRMIGYWLAFPASLVERLYGTKVVVSGDVIDRDEPAIILMNHRTRLDWLFMWNALYKMDPWLLTTEKISLKASLKKIPGAGWGMESGAFIFLERNFENDRVLMEDVIKYYKSSGRSYQLLLFAEGTDRGSRAVSLSHAFADKNDLPRYDYVLHPRTTGFTHLLQLMQKEKYIKYVYDATIAYKGEIVDSEMKLLNDGLFPKEVHFDVKKYDVNCVTEKPETWLSEMWKIKEERLRRFYETDGRFEPSGSRFVWPVESDGLGYSCVLIFWTLSSLFWLYCIYQYWFVKLYFIAGCSFFTYALIAHNGAGVLFLKWARSRLDF